MIIIGAKGFAKQLIEVFYQFENINNIYFFDNISEDCPDTLYGFKIIRSFEEVSSIIRLDPNFCLGIGKPLHRRTVAEKFISIGGHLTTVISPKAHIAKFVNRIGLGCTIITGAIVENDAILEDGVLINTLAVVHHDAIIGSYSEIGPGAKILGNVVIEENVFIGANATILPKLKIGKNAIIGAGSVVTKDVPEGLTVVGSSAKPIKYEL